MLTTHTLNTDSVKYSQNAIQILDCPIAMGHLMLDTVKPRLVALGLSIFKNRVWLTDMK